ncbi:MAG: beta-lactamase family protein [Lachnospiraceae bacterium]|nr:beta-lactamase family protein [Lachnospiraceae bacterium]
MSTDIEKNIDEYILRRRHRQINSVLLCRDDEVVAGRYYNGFNENSKNVINSVAKSIMSVCTGIALDKGLIQSLDEPVYKYIPEFRECREPLHRMITIRHLLTMTSGIYWNGGVHYHCPMMQQLRTSGDWISHIADCAVSDIPGQKYNYKEWDVILLAKVLDEACGDMFDFMDANLFEPLGIKSERWYKSPCGVYYSVGNGEEADNGTDNETMFKLTAIDMMKIGQLFLHGGTYEGKRIISENYIHQALLPLKCNPNYGFLWWIWEGRYGCLGYGGQSITVFPDDNAVIVTQATPTDRGMAYFDVVEYCRGMLRVR